MTLRTKWFYNIGRYGNAPADDVKWDPMPGEAVCDTGDRKGTFGLIVSVKKPLQQSFSLFQVDVLWSRELKLNDF